MSRPRGGAPAPASRQNEYFVSRDGIDREVISADICRYLGNDALVRPGHYEDPHTRQTVHGYYITAYRNLTSAMIEDLKADSARWDTERRTQSSRNTSGVQYRMSETHQSRQHHGPTNDNHYSQDSYGREPQYNDGPRYPGTGTAGYNGASGPYSQSYSVGGGGGYGGYQQQPPPPPQQQPVQHPPPPPPQQSPQPDPRYNGGYAQPSMDRDNRGYSTSQDGLPPGYAHTGAHQSRGSMPPRGYDNYPPPNPIMPASAATPAQPVYASAPAPQPSYPAPTSPFNNYPAQGPPAGSAFPSMHGTDGSFSRGGSAPDSSFGRAQSSAPPPATGFSGPGQQFAEAPNPRSSVPPPAISTANTATKRRSDRDDDRLTPSDRHSRQPRR